MRNIKHFERELALIKDDNLRQIVASYMENATPDYFWLIGASSSGKFHPAFSQNIGGLVRHTKAVVLYAQEILALSTYKYMPDIYKDYVIAASIVHDTCKFGATEHDSKAYPEHPRAAAENFVDYCEDAGYSVSEYLIDGIRGHMGQWSVPREDKPFTLIGKAVHEADYMASRKFIDIPLITEEWNAVEEINSSTEPEETQKEESAE